ncbi:hypothetical protein J41TS12_16670 [Paenibacillus antibioticophila]|uniref:Uncharacterized protein n=1 Tax=Paenibacillus antibioticophila TaxID=1274374 RepID=A0A920CEC2_9BACL|nr:hypothetical protein [Paenibacillus antibioticophila]GIO36806.1 hypothetical protein J41TS12_16670 [Paenibacillus antibioticophila]
MELLIAIILILILVSQGGAYVLQKKQFENQEKLKEQLELILKEMKKS